MIRLTPEEDHRANIATCFSILLAIALVIVAVLLNVRWLTCLWMILGGLGIHGGTNLIGLAIVRPALQRKPWAVLVIRALWPVIPIGLSLYVAGVLILIIKGLKAGFAAMLG